MPIGGQEGIFANHLHATDIETIGIGQVFDRQSVEDLDTMSEKFRCDEDEQLVYKAVCQERTMQCGTPSRP